MYNKEAFLFSESHLKQVVQICDTIKNSSILSAVKTVSYNKTYNDCSYLNLMNGFSDYFQKYCDFIKDRGKGFIEAIHNTPYDKPYIMIWPEVIDSQIFSLLYEHNIWHGISFLYRTKDGIETISLAGNRDSNNLPNSLINNMYYVLSFVENFRQEMNKICDKSNLQDRAIYKNQFDLNYNSGTPYLAVEKETEGEENFIKLSSREIQCMYLLCRGFSTKRIAQILNLSPRTVETYINNIKIKNGVKFKDELVAKYFDFYDDAK